MKVEVEFSPIYEGQALFAEVDQYLRSFGFMLFDLSRSRYRRGNVPRNFPTRGQLLWGDALYLKDYRRLTASEQALKLCLLAAALGTHDYALEAMDFVLREHALEDSCRKGLASARSEYFSELRSRSRWLWTVCALRKLGIKTRDVRKTEFSWVD